ncbi:MAG: 2'-5' RNA ligase family protein [bacterium]
MSYAITILPDEAVSDWVAVNRRGLARHFPVHVTIKTRFDLAADASVKQLEEVVRGVAPCEPFRAVLDGPYYIEDRIRWIECRPGNEGFDRIIGLHRACSSALWESDCAPVTDRVGVFEGHNYRPHITLDWENERIHVPLPSVVEERLKVSATFVAWAILQYSNDPLRRGVRVMKTREFSV